MVPPPNYPILIEICVTNSMVQTSPFHLYSLKGYIPNNGLGYPFHAHEQ